MAGLENNQSSFLTLSHALCLSLTHTQRLCFPESLLRSPRGPWDCVCMRVHPYTHGGGRYGGTYLLPSTPQSVLHLGKLLAVLSVTQFSIREHMSLSDPHGVPGNRRGGSGVACLEAGGCQSQGAGAQESWPGPAGSVLSRVPQEGSVDPCLPDQDPGGRLGLGPPPPSCSPLPCSAPHLPLRTWADPLRLPNTKPSLSQGLGRAPYRFLREPVSDSCTYRSRHPTPVTSLTGHSLKPERKCKELVCFVHCAGLSSQGSNWLIVSAQ